jgi:hypothetical protein
MQAWLQMSGASGPGIPASRAVAVAEALRTVGFDGPADFAGLEKADLVQLLEELENDPSVKLGDRTKLKRFLMPPAVTKVGNFTQKSSTQRSPSPAVSGRQSSGCSWGSEAPRIVLCVFVIAASITYLWWWLYGHELAFECGCLDTDVSILLGVVNLRSNCENRADMCLWVCKLLGRTVRSQFYQNCLTESGRQKVLELAPNSWL